MPTDTSALITIAEPFKLPDLIKNNVVSTLAPFVQQAGEIAREAEGVTVTDASQTEFSLKRT